MILAWTLFFIAQAEQDLLDREYVNQKAASLCQYDKQALFEQIDASNVKLAAMIEEYDEIIQKGEINGPTEWTNKFTYIYFREYDDAYMLSKYCKYMYDTSDCQLVKGWRKNQHDIRPKSEKREYFKYIKKVLKAEAAKCMNGESL